MIVLRQNNYADKDYEGLNLLGKFRLKKLRRNEVENLKRKRNSINSMTVSSTISGDPSFQKQAQRSRVLNNQKIIDKGLRDKIESNPVNLSLSKIFKKTK